jgi:hypothetical protein
MFRVVSPSWRQSSSDENRGWDSSFRLSTARLSVSSDCERHSLALFPQICFASAYTRSASDLGARSTDTHAEIRHGEHYRFGHRRPSDELYYGVCATRQMSKNVFATAICSRTRLQGSFAKSASASSSSTDSHSKRISSSTLWNRAPWN